MHVSISALNSNTNNACTYERNVNGFYLPGALLLMESLKPETQSKNVKIAHQNQNVYVCIQM